MKIKFTPSARAQFLAVIEHIAVEDPRAARRVRLRVEKALRHLTTFPTAGRQKLPEFPALPHREVIVAPFRVFYRVQLNVLWVVAVWHSAQDARERAE